MEVTVNIPDNIARQLEPSGGDLSRRALEALAIEGYRREELSLGQVAEMLGLSIDEANGLLKEHNIPLNLTLEDIERGRATLNALLDE